MVAMNLRIKDVVDGVTIAVLDYEDHHFPRPIVLRTPRSRIFAELIPLLELHVHFV